MDKPSVNLPNFITGYYGPRSSSSRAFQALVRSIGEVKSKHEEDRIIREEFANLKGKIGQPSSPKQMREYLVRLIYCEMLGIDASEFHIHAINFAQQKNLIDKRVGYLALSLFLHENHPLIVLLINTLQRDLKSTNVLEVCCALTALCKLITTEMIPTVLPQVLSLLEFKRDIIRKKAVMALQRLYQKCPSMIPDIEDKALKALKDRDFGVTSATLHLLYDLIVESPPASKHLVPLFVQLQVTIASGKLNQQFDYHGIPCPWVQIKNLKILALLGVDDKKSSKLMYEALNKTLASLRTNTLIGYAVAYECCRTITTIYPNKVLIGKATKCIGLFLVARSNDIKCLGITALAALVQVNSAFATEPAYQRIVIDCLHDPDETLKRKTLDLLCRLTSASNVELVCEKLISHLRLTVDTYFRADLVARVTELAERYAPDNSWYILTMNEVLELGGELVLEEVAHNLMRLIAEGNNDQQTDAELRRFAVVSYMDLLEKPVIPDILIQVISWVLGEYSFTASEFEPEAVLDQLCGLLDRKYQDPTTMRWVVTAIGKLTAQMGHIPDNVEKLLNNQSVNGDMDLRQRCHEIQQLSRNADIMQKALPVDASCEDLEVDSSLSLLDEYVSDSLTRGATPYKPAIERTRDLEIKQKDIKESETTLKYQPYEPPVRPYQEPITEPSPPVHEKKREPKHVKQPRRKILEAQSPQSQSTVPVVKGPWGPGGYSKGRGRSGSGSGDSGSKSGSSSRSSGSERVPVVKTKAETTPSPLVFSHEDARKKQFADDLFKGVGNKEQSPTFSKRNGPHRGPGRGSRTHPRQKTPVDKAYWQLPEPGDPPVLPPCPRVKGREKKPEVDLLLNFESGDSNEPPPDEEQQPKVEHEFRGVKSSSEHSGRGGVVLVPSLEELSTKGDLETTLAKPCPEDNIEGLETDLGKSSVIADDNSGRLFTDNNDCVNENEHLNEEISVETITDRRKLPLMAENIENKISKQKSSAVSLIDADISEHFTPVAIHEPQTPSLALPDDLKEFPHSKERYEVCCDRNLRVTLQKVFKPDELVLVLFLTNQSHGNSSVSNVVTMLEPPSNLRATFDSSTESRLCDKVVEPLSSVTHCVNLKFKSPALYMNFAGKITYKDSINTSKNLFLSYTLTMRDLLRPLVLSTDEFGERWNQAAFEKRQKVTGGVTSCGELIKRAEEGLGLHPVEVVGSKAIAVGTVLQSSICLLHGTVNNGGTLDLWIKTNSQLLSEAIMKQCVAVFQQ